jgi:hypothetical protein
MTSTQVIGLLRQKVCARAGTELDLTRKVYDYFRKYDSNGDGQLSKEEFRQSLEDMCQVYLKDQQLNELFDDIDINGDGVLDRKEVLATFLGRRNTPHLQTCLEMNPALSNRKHLLSQGPAHRKILPTSQGLDNVPPVEYVATENQADVKAPYLTTSQVANSTVTGGRQARRIQLLGPGVGLTTRTNPDKTRQRRSEWKHGGLTKLWA